MSITNKQDLILWLKSKNINLDISDIPNVEPHVQPLRNTQWSDIDHDFSEDEYYFKYKNEEYYSTQRCHVWLRKNSKQIEVYLVRTSPSSHFSRYGKIKPRYVSLLKEKEIFESIEKFQEYIKLLFPEIDFSMER